jgi:hypothetical protein
MSDRAIKQVSISLTDEFEKRLLEFASKQGAFSKYVKRLIHADMSGTLGAPQKPANVSVSRELVRKPKGDVNSFT